LFYTACIDHVTFYIILFYTFYTAYIHTSACVVCVRACVCVCYKHVAMLYPFIQTYVKAIHLHKTGMFEYSYKAPN